MSVPSFDMYRALRCMCQLYGIPVHDVSRSTLHSWKTRGVSDVYIESLALRLYAGSVFTLAALSDLAASAGYDFPTDLLGF